MSTEGRLDRQASGHKVNEKRKESQRAVRKAAQQPQSDGLCQCGGRRKDGRRGGRRAAQEPNRRGKCSNKTS